MVTPSCGAISISSQLGPLTTRLTLYWWRLSRPGGALLLMTSLFTQWDWLTTRRLTGWGRLEGMVALSHMAPWLYPGLLCTVVNTAGKKQYRSGYM